MRAATPSQVRVVAGERRTSRLALAVFFVIYACALAVVFAPEGAFDAGSVLEHASR
jgi:hypothetical protein